MLIKIAKLNKNYGARAILTDINICVDKGSFVMIVGNSGSGKTTLLQIIGMMCGNYDGEIYFNDQIVNSNKNRYLLRRANIGFVFQSCNFITYLNVIENICMPLLANNIKIAHAKNIAEKYLYEFSMLNVKDKKIQELSVGEKQRIAIIKSIIHDPDIICADEPTGNLDYNNSLLVMNILRSIVSEKNKSIFMITHDRSLITYAERSFELQDSLLKEI